MYLTADGAAELSAANYKWSRTTLFRRMQDIGFTFSRGPIQ